MLKNCNNSHEDLFHIYNMGIAGLLKNLRSITKRVHIREYQGLTAAVDLHCWIHKGSIGCCRELSEGIETSSFVEYCLAMLKLLIAHGVKPLVVFDGRSLPAKQITNTSRRNSRHENKEKAREAEADGRMLEAHSFYQKTTTVTPAMVKQIILALKKNSIQFIVSPYEADAQLAYLSLSGAVDVIITEDSDALVYGCRRVLFKLDKDGSGDEVRRRSLGANQGLSFLNWTDDQFKLMCCLAGCDYVKKIRNVGIVTAHKFVSKYKTFHKTTEALLISKYDGVDSDYIMQLRRALNTFKYQTVYDPEAGCLRPLSEMRDKLMLNYDARFGRKPIDDADCEYLGTFWDPSKVKGVATGLLHPYTLLPYDDIPDGLCLKKNTSESEKQMKDQGDNEKEEKVTYEKMYENNVNCAIMMNKNFESQNLFESSIVWVSEKAHDSYHKDLLVKENELENLSQANSVRDEYYCGTNQHEVPRVTSSQSKKRSSELVDDEDVEAVRMSSQRGRSQNDCNVKDSELWKFDFNEKVTKISSVKSSNPSNVITTEHPDWSRPQQSSLRHSLPLFQAASSAPTSSSHNSNGNRKVSKGKRRRRTVVDKNPEIDFVPLQVDMLHRKSKHYNDDRSAHKDTFFIHANHVTNVLRGDSEVEMVLSEVVPLADDDSTYSMYENVPLAGAGQGVDRSGFNSRDWQGHDTATEMQMLYSSQYNNEEDNNLFLDWNPSGSNSHRTARLHSPPSHQTFQHNPYSVSEGLNGYCEPDCGIIRYRPLFSKPSRSQSECAVGVAGGLGRQRDESYWDAVLGRP